MQLNELLSPEATLTHINPVDKTGLMRLIADKAVLPGCHLTVDQVFEALMARERLGSTGVGEGIAIPHCRLTCLSRPRGLLLKLEQPVDFDSLDGHPVDLVFVLLTPAAAADVHLNVLSYLATLFNHAEYRDALRTARDATELYQRAVDFPLEPTTADLP